MSTEPEQVHAEASANHASARETRPVGILSEASPADVRMAAALERLAQVEEARDRRFERMMRAEADAKAAKRAAIGITLVVVAVVVGVRWVMKKSGERAGVDGGFDGGGNA